MLAFSGFELYEVVAFNKLRYGHLLMYHSTGLASQTNECGVELIAAYKAYNWHF
jgi:hypothetical protein